MLAHLYNVLWYPALPFALLAAGGRDSRIRLERLGRLDPYLAGERAKRIWVHAASVGEIEAVRPVIIRLAREVAGLEVVLTTMTATGREAARHRLPGLGGYYLAPLDFGRAVRRFLSHVRPHLILIAETELWPNFFFEGSRAGAKVALINGRLSVRSVRRYRMARGLLAAAFARANRILVQTTTDAARFRELGAPDDRLIVTGNTKFDVDDTPAPLRPVLAAFARARPILVAGSTAPGEEAIVLGAYRQLRERFPALALAIAPRHLERIAEVEGELRASGVTYAKASALADGAGHHTGVLLIDTMGELRSFYRRATIAFVGGSLAPPRGGQSLAEPAAAAIPVLFGPYHENQREVADAILANGGGAVVGDAITLAGACANWLADDGARRSAGHRAREVIERLADGAALTVRHLKPLLLSA
ncbi:MAG: 3-deoxy-D-manno-octulosonic acid transferase [Candidatus Binataceae bacterium]